MNLNVGDKIVCAHCKRTIVSDKTFAEIVAQTIQVAPELVNEDETKNSFLCDDCGPLVIAWAKRQRQQV